MTFIRHSQPELKNSKLNKSWFEEENESVMVTCDEWLTLGSMSTHLKLAKARFRWVDIDPRVSHSSRVSITDSLYIILVLKSVKILRDLAFVILRFKSPVCWTIFIKIYQEKIGLLMMSLQQHTILIHGCYIHDVTICCCDVISLKTWMRLKRKWNN